MRDLPCYRYVIPAKAGTHLCDILRFSSIRNALPLLRGLYSGEMDPGFHRVMKFFHISSFCDLRVSMVK